MSGAGARRTVTEPDGGGRRLRLDEALDAMPSGGFLRRVSQRFRRQVWMAAGRSGDGERAVAGRAAGGGWGGYHAALRTMRAGASAQNAASAGPGGADINATQIAGVSSITLEPGSENVEVRFDRVTPETAFGTLERSADSAAIAGGSAQPRQPGGTRRFSKPAGAGMQGRA